MSAINEEYTKMPLRNHFGGSEADCKTDHKVGRVPRFDLSQGYRSIEAAAANGFALLVQSNANCLHPAEYLLMRQYASLRHVELLPGAEINLHNWECQEKILHVVLIFAPTENVLEVESKLAQSHATNGKYRLELEQLVEGVRVLPVLEVVEVGLDRPYADIAEMPRQGSSPIVTCGFLWIVGISL